MSTMRGSFVSALALGLIVTACASPQYGSWHARGPFVSEIAELHVYASDVEPSKAVRIEVADRRAVTTIKVFEARKSITGIEAPIKSRVENALKSQGFLIADKDSADANVLTIVIQVVDFGVSTTPLAHRPWSDVRLDGVCDRVDNETITYTFEGSAEPNTVFFLPSDVDGLINESLSGALEKLVNDERLLICLGT